MKDLFCDGFQAAVDGSLVRHKSIIDIMTKLSEATTRVNRAVAKSVTNCGCLSINAERQVFPSEVALAELSRHVSSHVGGELCEQCREAVESEIGRTLFYLAAMCNVLGLNLYDTMIKENQRITTLGPYNIS